MIELRICAGGPVVAAESWGLPGPTALLVHGWSGSAADMQMMAIRLVQAGWRAVALDLPAHGGSSGRYTSLPEMITAIAAVASALGPIDAVIAHSLGATAVTLALSQDHLQTRAAVLLSPAAGPEYFLERHCGSVGLPARLVAGVMRRVQVRVGRELAALNAPRAARRLDVPVLIMHDREDRQVPFAHAQAIAEAWPGSVLLAVPGTGHRRILNDPIAARATLEFLVHS